jgi:hypothetical protein
MKGTSSQSTTSYFSSGNNSDSKELEAVHGYDVRTRRRKTPSRTQPIHHRERQEGKVSYGQDKEA